MIASVQAQAARYQGCKLSEKVVLSAQITQHQSGK